MILLLPLILVLAGGLIVLGRMASDRAMHPASGIPAHHLRDFPSLDPAPVEFSSKTGIRIAGRFFPGRSRSTIILSHGYGGSQDEMLPVVDFLHRAGFSVFTYAMRGCGGSGGSVTFGALEQQDLISAVDYLTSRSDVDKERIGALGFSMGAGTTVLAAAHDARIKAVVDDSGWSNVYHWLRPSIRTMLLHPTAPFSPLSLKLVELRTGTDLSKLRPVDEIGRLSPRPILIIHGTADQVVPPGDSQQNFSAARDPKELWWIDGATHGQTIEPVTPAYSQRVADFFQRSLQP